MNLKIILFTILMMRLIGNLIMKWVIYRKATAEIMLVFQGELVNYVNCK